MTIAEQLEQIGEQRGEERGREEGERKAKLEIALAMLQKGMDTTPIMEMTGLSKDEFRSELSHFLGNFPQPNVSLCIMRKGWVHVLLLRQPN